MTPHQIVSHYGAGSVKRAADVLPVTRQTLYAWLMKQSVPGRWQAWIERDTAGVLKADPKAKP